MSESGRATNHGLNFSAVILLHEATSLVTCRMENPLQSSEKNLTPKPRVTLREGKNVTPYRAGITTPPTQESGADFTPESGPHPGG